METNFEVLTALDTKGKTKTWEIKVVNLGDYSEIITKYGYTNKIESIVRVSQGKNIGKSNETTHYQQAVAEAKSKWTSKQTRENYKPVNGGEENGDETETTTEITPIFPMLAQDYFKHQNKLKFPCYIQSKLDGYRCIYRNGVCTSRQTTEFNVIYQTELYQELKMLNEISVVFDGEPHASKAIVFDGELYLHNAPFEHLGILRKKKLSKEDLENLNQIEYHIYDIIDETLHFDQRYQLLKTIDFSRFKKIKLVQTEIIHNESELKTAHSEFINQNYEGSIIRNRDGMYRCKARSTDLLKYKDFQDSEYTISDFTFEKDTSGENDDLIVWICETDTGDHFNVRPQGTKQERKTIYQNCQTDFSRFRGQKLWVKFFELTDRGVPRFPTTKTNKLESYIRNAPF